MNSRGELRVLSDARQVAEALADSFVINALEALAARRTFAVALAGGNTPKAAYALLASEPRKSQVDWNNVHVYFGDERCVPPDDDRSNYKMAQDSLLSHVAIPPDNVFRMHGEGDPQEAARLYAELLKKNLGNPPVFDLIMLGMGTDAHTASLFPGADPHSDEELFVRAVYVETAGMYRLTFTPAVINAARCVVIATEGTSKTEALNAVFSQPVDPRERPVQSVAPRDGQLIWLVDRAAAGNLAAIP